MGDSKESMNKRRILFGSQYKFPLKLFEIVNDGVLLQWNADGDAIIADQKNFENHVMQLYPGFVQVRSFHNLRRLFRDYNFTHQTLRKSRFYGQRMEFRHPCFKRDRPERRFLLRKKRRIGTRLTPLATSSPKNPKHKNWTRNLTHNFYSLGPDEKSSALSDLGWDIGSHNYLTEQSDSDYGYMYKKKISSVSLTIEDFRTTKQTSANQPDLSVRLNNSKKSGNEESLKREDLYRLLHIYAMNELTPSEFWQLISRQCGQNNEYETWEAIETFFNDNVKRDLSPLHHKGFYYVFDLSEL